jgi:hypothetical protein
MDLANLEEISTTMIVDDKQLESLSSLCKEMLEQQEMIANLEEQLKTVREKERKLSEEYIPNKMSELGYSKLQLKDGQKIEIKPFYAAKIPSERVQEAFQWLRDNGHGDLIKNNVTLTFGRSQDNEAKNLVDELKQKGHNVNQVEKVEPMTLKAFVKDEIQQGRSVPSDLFGVYIANKTKITT